MMSFQGPARLESAYTEIASKLCTLFVPRPAVLLLYSGTCVPVSHAAVTVIELASERVCRLTRFSDDELQRRSHK